MAELQEVLNDGVKLEVSDDLSQDYDAYVLSLRHYAAQLKTHIDSALESDVLDSRALKDVMGLYQSVNDALLSRQGGQYLDINNAIERLGKLGYRVIRL